MAWGQLAVDKPHLVYIILGGFTSLFMLCSSVIKERLYIGEATVATLCGVIFGPYAANLIDPGTWGNTDRITLEFSRIVLVVQCFAVGVELPRAYMERHWRSVTFLLIPVMTFGWLITSLFIWLLMHGRLNWLDSLVCAACVTATDPVLASSVVGKGKFAKRVPKHLRDLLSAESGCNDGMAFPFIYLSLYLVQLNRNAGEVTWHWIGITILYECVFGAIYGVVVGYLARRAIRYAHERDLIDRESFLVFYFVLALFCAGSGSILGIDDLLVGFACGVGFSNDGWFGEKTEESHVSNVIDLLINLAFFVYFGTIIPWNQYHSAVLGTSWWQFFVLAILVLLFRRIPIMMLLKPMIPDVKTWREALFAGHFGPIGVGAIFVAIMARAELETESTTPLAELPGPGTEWLNIIELIWPLTTFLVMASILVHGSSIAVFTLGKHINTLTITMSYTQANEEGGWMDRLPRIQSRAKTSASYRRPDVSEESLSEKSPDYPAATLGLPRNFLRRQREDDNPSRASSLSRRRRRDKPGGGGHIEDSAISPQPREPDSGSGERSGSDTLATRENSHDAPDDKYNRGKDETGPPKEVYQEGNDAVIEDDEGEVLDVVTSQEGASQEERQEDINRDIERLMSNEQKEDGGAQKKQSSKPPTDRRISSVKRQESATERNAPLQQQETSGREGRGMLQRMGTFAGLNKEKTREEKPPRADPPNPHRSGAARAYRFGRTIIVEDEDGEVIKKYDIPAPERRNTGKGGNYADTGRTRQRLQRMSTYLGMSHNEEPDEVGPSTRKKGKGSAKDINGDEGIRFTMDGQTQRMNTVDFIRHIEGMNPQKRAQVVAQSTANKFVKNEARADADEHEFNARRAGEAEEALAEIPEVNRIVSQEEDGRVRTEPQDLTQIDSNTEIPIHSFARDLRGRETAAAQRRRKAAAGVDYFTLQPSPSRRESSLQLGTRTSRQQADDDQQETAAERRRREAAFGVSAERSDSEEDTPRARATGSRSETGADARRRAAGAGSSHGVRDRDSDDSPSRGRVPARSQQDDDEEPEETTAEKRRRKAALGLSKEGSDSDSEAGDATHPREPPPNAMPGPPETGSVSSPQEPTSQTGIRFADPAPRGPPRSRRGSAEGSGGRTKGIRVGKRVFQFGRKEKK